MKATALKSTKDYSGVYSINEQPKQKTPIAPFKSKDVKFNFYLKEKVFYSKTKNANSEYSIILSCYYGYKENKSYKPIRYFTGITITKSEWDGKQVVKNTHAQMINNNLEHYKQVCQRIIEGYYYMNSGVLPTPTFVKEKLDAENLTKSLSKITKKFDVVYDVDVKKPVHHSFTEFVSAKIQREKDVKKLTHDSGKQYVNLVNHILEYEKGLGSQVLIEKIDETFIEDFFIWLMKKGKYTESTMNKFKKGFKKYLRLAGKEIGDLELKIKWNDSDILVKKTTIDGDKIALFQKELEAIEKADLSKLHPSYSRVRDLFIVACYSGGKRISDYDKLHLIKNPDNGRFYIEDISKKTGTFTKIPAFKKVVNIWNKYGGCFPKMCSAQQFNDMLKVIAEKAGLKDKVQQVRKINGKQVIAHPFKYQLITAHTARRTFCTMMVKDFKFSPLTIMQYSGHKSLEEFLNYVRLDKEQHFEMFDERLKELGM